MSTDEIDHSFWRVFRPAANAGTKVTQSVMYMHIYSHKYRPFFLIVSPAFGETNLAMTLDVVTCCVLHSSTQTIEPLLLPSKTNIKMGFRLS